MDASLSPNRSAAGTADLAELEALFRLKALPRLGDRTLLRLLETFGSARGALDTPEARFRTRAPDVPAGARKDPGAASRARAAVQAVKSGSMDVLVMGTPGYPEHLLHLHDPPAVLFYRGLPALLELPAVAVVGARRSTEAGRRIAEYLAGAVAARGVVVVSGMALGIDGAAHRGALAAGGPTVAVLGSGVDRPTPGAHRGLHGRIAEGGLVLSEFLPGTPAAPHAFPRRNRIIAALSAAVVVVEAAERSGALITVDHAMDLGREVFAVPGPLDRRQSRGTNRLIRDGARILLDPDQLLEELDLGGTASVARGPAAGAPPTLPLGVPGPEPGSDAGRMLAVMEDEPASGDRLAREAGLEVSRALAALSQLEVEGWVDRHPGMRFARGRERVR